MNSKDINDFQNNLIKTIKDLVKQELKGLNNRDHYGRIDSVVDQYKAYVYVDNGTISQLIPTNPNITFSANEEVYVVFINGDEKDKFVLCQKAINPNL